MKTLILAALLLISGVAHADLEDDMIDMHILQQMQQWDAEDAARDRRDLDAAYETKDCAFLDAYWSKPHHFTYADKRRYKTVCGGELGPVHKP